MLLGVFICRAGAEESRQNHTETLEKDVPFRFLSAFSVRVAGCCRVFPPKGVAGLTGSKSNFFYERLLIIIIDNFSRLFSVSYFEYSQKVTCWDMCSMSICLLKNPQDQ